MTFKSVNHLKAALFNGNLKPTQGINERRGVELDARFSKSSAIVAEARISEAEFMRDFQGEFNVATSEMVHPKGNKRD